MPPARATGWHDAKSDFRRLAQVRSIERNRRNRPTPQSVDQSRRDRIACAGTDDRHVLGRLLSGERGGIAERDDDIDVGGFELGREAVESRDAPVGGSLDDDEVLPVNEAVRGQSREERRTTQARIRRGQCWSGQ